LLACTTSGHCCAARNSLSIVYTRAKT